MCCSVLQCVAVRGSVWQRVAACCSVLQRVAACCSMLQRVTACCKETYSLREDTWRLSFSALCCSVLQCVAVCCSVLQCVETCCSALQCVAEAHTLEEKRDRGFQSQIATQVASILRKHTHNMSKVCCSVLQFVAVCVIAVCSLRKHTHNMSKVCCSVLQFVAVCLLRKHTHNMSKEPHHIAKKTQNMYRSQNMAK